MNPIKIYPPGVPVSGAVDLPASKSIANRLLIINSLNNSTLDLQAYSDSGDTLLLKNILQNLNPHINAGEAGTVFRFLTAYLSGLPGTWNLSGSERMLERPIGPLVLALKQSGADIQYQGRDGYPPLLILGKKLKGGKVDIDASLSSQFVSALLLIGPYMHEGLHVQMNCTPASVPYIKMTIDLMKKGGAEVDWKENEIIVKPGIYSSVNINVETDWSSAVFWYELCAISQHASILLKDLQINSIQGDAATVSVMNFFQVKTRSDAKGVRIEKLNMDKTKNFFSLDCRDIPDLVPALVCTCAALGIKAEFSGIRTLKIKESNRIHALQTELRKLGLQSVYNSEDDILRLENGRLKTFSGTLNTHNDHRIAMALAPLALVCGPLCINDSEVVEKSYPSFWEQLTGLGFVIEKLDTRIEA